MGGHFGWLPPETKHKTSRQDSPTTHSEPQFPRSYLLAGHQRQAVLFPVQDLAENVVEDQQLAPAVLQQLHLVPNLGGEEAEG